jgi:hypothetical protein
MASFREINYALRPAKAVERKMMLEFFRSLGLGWPLREYRYIGMGSIYFADFQLIHQSLGVTKMISFESSEGDVRRCDFNKPFKCIEVVPGESSKSLLGVAWDIKSIVWLDYDGELNSSGIADCRTCIQNLPSGSILAISINVETKNPPHELSSIEEKNKWRLEEFKDRVGLESTPMDLTGASLRGPGIAKACWDVLQRAVTAQLNARNGRSDIRHDTMHVSQIFHFRYADGASMMTVGWVLYSEEEKSKFEACGFSSIGFMRSDASAFEIRAPKLTPKEIRHLNSALPDGTVIPDDAVSALASKTGVPQVDIKRYAEVYRFYPQYAEVTL